MTNKYNLPTHITIESLQRTAAGIDYIHHTVHNPQALGMKAYDYVLSESAWGVGIIVENYYFSEKEQMGLLEHLDPYECRSLLYNPSTTSKTLYAISQTNWARDDYSIAMNVNTCPKTLTYLLSVGSLRVQEAVALNPKTPDKCLRKIKNKYPPQYTIHKNAKATLRNKKQRKSPWAYAFMKKVYNLLIPYIGLDKYRL